MSNSNTTTSSSSGIGFLGLLTVVFITLKLTGYVSWSWWWVLCPLWGPTALIILIGLVIGLVAVAIGNR